MKTKKQKNKSSIPKSELMERVRPITEADKEAFDRMPDDGWFSPDDLPFQINRPTFRCKRLFAHGLLHRRVSISAPYNEYSKAVPFI